jgi:hypothetical protein
LIALNESLKQQEAQFKAACGRQRGQLKETEAALRAAQDSEESKRLGEIERRHGEMLKQYTRLKVRHVFAALILEVQHVLSFF